MTQTTPAARTQRGSIAELARLSMKTESLRLSAQQVRAAIDAAADKSERMLLTSLLEELEASLDDLENTRSDLASSWQEAQGCTCGGHTATAEH